MKKAISIVFIILMVFLSSTVSSIFSCSPSIDSGFTFRDEPGEYLDILFNNQIVARYMYAYDKSTEERLHETYKPYLHVFDVAGKIPITKGPGGLYTHHRGIFIGWNELQFDGKTYDFWHMKGVEIVHQKFLQKTVSLNQATFTSLTHWDNEKGKTIIEEERTMSLHQMPSPGRLLIDFTSKLKASNGDVGLYGDPEHAGVQYRPANEIVADETIYIFPKEEADPLMDFDYPWVGETYTLGSKSYSVVHMNHPDNPKKTKYSAYRDYGRFGAFFEEVIKSGQSLTIKYRFLIADGEMLSIEVIQKSWEKFAGFN